MQLGMVGLGRMGANMTRRLMRDGHQLVVSDLSADTVKELAGEGAGGSSSLEDLVGKLKAPRAVWVMVPSGNATEQTVQKLAQHMQAGDTILDGGNSYFKDDVRRAEEFKGKGIHYVDVGTSGGVWGLERGYCMMIGGPDEAVQRLDPIFKTLAPGKGDISRTPGREKLGGTAEEGYIHCGPSGSGHFVKMVHNGIEYGIMQAYAEGFDIFKNATSKDPPPEGFSGLQVSRDGKSVAVRGPDGRRGIWRLDAGKFQPIPGLGAKNLIVGWMPDGQSVYVAVPQDSRKTTTVYRVNIQTGKMEEWKTFGRENGTTDAFIGAPHLSDDGSAYAYIYDRVLSEAYVVTGLK